VLRVVLSYLMRPGTKVMDILAGMTEPMLGPVRQLLPKSPGLDFAPLVTLLLLQGLQYLLHMLF